MQIHSTAGRRLVGVLLALGLALGLLQTASAPAAHADPSDTITKFDWDIGDLEWGGDAAHSNYWYAIDQLHRISGHDIPNHPEVASQLDETTLLPTRLIEARILTHGQYRGSLYWWADNLYFAGFYQPAYDNHPGTHYGFPDVWPTEFQQATHSVNFQRLPWDGNYSRLPGGGSGERAGRAIGYANLTNALTSIATAATRIQRDPNAFAREMVTIIQATSEAARFGRIFDNIRGNIRNYTSNAMGSENVDLQQHWDDASTFVYRRLGGQTPTFSISGRTFQTLAAFLAYVGYMELHAKVPR
ncbi:ribosome-inactivating family protein [Kitasatospora sp. NBC_01560]|uniref:ribosome-inactivating family protein n=1 Tax=Kitasatospora sp. NBC_01560 TaxID=2975965 RepID=UPI00386D90A7